MVKRIVALCLLAGLLFTAVARADMVWKKDTPAQEVLADYIGRVNSLLTAAGETKINSLFEIYDEFAVLGITEEENAETPEGVEITVRLDYQTIDTLQLRVNDPNRFVTVAAALIRALYGESMTQEDAAHIPAVRASKAKTEPDNSFEEEIDELNGTIPRFYYAYYPNQYHDGVSWMQMTVIFPIAGQWDGKGMILGESEKRTPTPDADADPDYEGYFSTDDYDHFEIFMTPTPEPDSAAMEYDFHQNGH